MKQHTRSTQFSASELETEPLMAPADSIIELLQHTEAFGTWRVQTDTGKVWWSPNVYKILGLEPQKGAVDIEQAVKVYHPDDIGTVNYLIEGAMENKKGFEFILRLIRADGKTRFVESVGMVKEDNKGHVVFIYGVFRDITDRISEKEVSTRRGMLVNSIVRNSPAPLVILDRQMKYMQISPSWAKAHKLSDIKSYLGKSHYSVMKDLPEEWKAEHKRALKGEVITRTTAHTSHPEATGLQSGSIVFPWWTSKNQVGGLIIMVTSPLKSAAEIEGTVSHIAGLMKRSTRSDKFAEIR